MAANMQGLRLRRPDTPKATKKPRHTGILQDQLRRAARPPWTPSFSLAFRLFLLLRVSAAMYSNIQDCDEVFNFWEPLHYLDRGVGFQTWEVSPQYAIRSWAYILLHLLPAWGPVRLLSISKRQEFFAVRIFLAIVCSLCEAKFYRTIVESLNIRVGRYALFMLLFSAGMWNASTAFLPSSFAMYANMLAASYAFQPPSASDHRRTFMATFLFAAGSIIGWPFSLLVAVPFVLEEMFAFAAYGAPSSVGGAWQRIGIRRLFLSGMAASSLFIPVVFIDSVAYGRFVIAPLNIITYNLFGGPGRGPKLYGSEPWYFYIFNLLLNFNILVLLALISLPALALTYSIDRKRLAVQTPGLHGGPAFSLMVARLSPLYLWIGALTLQAHKEERFMFPVYPLVCFNAAVTLYLTRGLLEKMYITITRSPYKASRASLFSLMTLCVISVSVVLSTSRIFALSRYYHAPLDIAFQFESTELPRLLNVTGLLSTPAEASTSAEDEYNVHVDLSPIKKFGLRLCFGKEWYRFPGHYLIPDGVDVQFIKSDFDGLLPRHFDSSTGNGRIWKREATRNVPSDLNDLNQAEPNHYVDVSTCDYLIDTDFPHASPTTSVHEPRFASDTFTWDRVICIPFLDASHSPLLTRILWFPASTWSRENLYGDYCLLRHRGRAQSREKIKL